MTFLSHVFETMTHLKRKKVGTVTEGNENLGKYMRRRAEKGFLIQLEENRKQSTELGRR